jgi:hypothetical protein
MQRWVHIIVYRSISVLYFVKIIVLGKSFINHRTLRNYSAANLKKSFRKHQGSSKWDSSTQSLYLKSLYHYNVSQQDETIPHTLRIKSVESIDPNTGKGTAIVERSQIGSEALRRENPNYSNYDIREIVTKDCIETWQKATIWDALPEEYKDKQKAEAAEEANKARYGSAQTTEFDNTENRAFMRDSNLAESGSVGPIEDVSKD